MIDAPRWPVLIIATPRSGSTELAFQIWKRINQQRYPNEHIETGCSLDHLPDSVHCFIEPDKHEQDAAILDTMLANNNHNYIAKFIVSQTDNNERLADVLKTDCYKIKLDRDSLEDQAISLYIATVARRWDQHTATVEDFSVPINVQELRNSVNIIKGRKRQLQSLDIEFDLSLTYEDLDFSNPVDCYKNTEPTNMNVIRQLIRTFI
jgi:hypothetical protein